MMATPGSNSWPFVPLPPPVRPIPPDFAICSPFYGTHLVLSTCTRAAGKLPTGSTPVNYGRLIHGQSRQANSGNYNLPIRVVEEDLWGDCQVIVQNSNLFDRFLIGHQLIAPDLFRSMASWIIDQCVAPNGWGGFGTVSLQRFIDWVANDTTTNTDLQNWDRGSGVVNVPRDAPLYTVTVIDEGAKYFMPAYYDPAIAEALAYGVSQKGNHARGNIIGAQAESMARGSYNAWWEGFRTVSSEPRSEMIYTCDDSLGSPSSADCSELAHSGLGPPSDTLIIEPGPGAKCLSLKSCNVEITTSTAISLTWAQIGAGLNTLINICVMHPLVTTRGGRAYAGATSSFNLSGRGKNRKRAAAALNGMNALPHGVNITLFDQDFSTAEVPL